MIHLFGRVGLVEAVATQEGGIEKEESLPGAQVKWSAEFEPAQAPAAASAGDSRFTWTEDATARLNRVPAGFMRDMTREEVGKVATEKGVTVLDLTVCEDGLGHARETMNEVIAGYVPNKKPR